MHGRTDLGTTLGVVGGSHRRLESIEQPRQKDRQTDRQTHKQTRMQTHRHTDTQTLCAQGMNSGSRHVATSARARACVCVKERRAAQQESRSWLHTPIHFTRHPRLRHVSRRASRQRPALLSNSHPAQTLKAGREGAARTADALSVSTPRTRRRPPPPAARGSLRSLCPSPPHPPSSYPVQCPAAARRSSAGTRTLFSR